MIKLTQTQFDSMMVVVNHWSDCLVAGYTAWVSDIFEYEGELHFVVQHGDDRDMYRWDWIEHVWGQLVRRDAPWDACE